MPPRRIVADLTLAVNPMVVDLMAAANLMAEAGTDNGSGGIRRLTVREASGA